ncbi:GNAT family N-acetyltransferase [Kocuria turfanensis]|uniref:N-acetyltransferase n=2 Tax=Kocuria turfanensis TaxID=388357 RepID=A0A512IH23_9MICC|nr:GNAT family N-acetyltransferase [Kocuria turfanensis]GEO97006.1 N-acetyltransferase [Kocuria turfanensis]
MDAVAADPPPGLLELEQERRNDRIWVSTDEEDHPVGHLRLHIVDGAPHVEQLSVDPAHGRLGHGRALLEQAQRWATASGAHRMTLTTYRHVPWNGPFYARQGWRELAPDELGDQLKAVRAAEAAHGLDRWPRMAMVKDL